MHTVYLFNDIKANNCAGEENNPKDLIQNH